MQILVVGEKEVFEEIKTKFGQDHRYVQTEDPGDIDSRKGIELIFDFQSRRLLETLKSYSALTVPVFISMERLSFKKLSQISELSPFWFGFNGMPTFINRGIFEVTIHDPGQTKMLDKVCKNLKTECIIVDDRVGMVTPRVITMIINEAYYTYQEGTASREDIDKAMNLGTNYPYGPFEWCKRIGVSNVYEVLEAIHNDTGDDRYMICPALKKEYLNGRSGPD